VLYILGNRNKLEKVALYRNTQDLLTKVIVNRGIGLYVTFACSHFITYLHTLYKNVEKRSRVVN